MLSDFEWWNSWVRLWDRVAKHYQVDASLTCACTGCGRVYDVWRAYDDDTKPSQGNDLCAWSLQDKDGRWVIHCGYGSDFDLHEFWYIDNYPTAPADPICDWCLRRMLKAGTIIDSGKELSIG
jgi:hypothetical protein